MTAAAALPEAIDDLAAVAAVEAASRVLRTPCGDGHVVWHAWGDAAGAPVLLLHGGSGSWTHWVRNIAALVRAGRRVCVPDLPGFGDSARPPSGHDADALPPWLEQGLAEVVGADTAVDVVGFSFGALVGGLMASRRVARVQRLVLVGASALSGETRPRLDLRAWSALPAGPRRDAVHRHNLATLMLARAESIDALALALHAANLERDRMRRRRLALTDLLRRTLPDIACPVAGIWGADDALYRDRLQTVEQAMQQAPQFRSLVLIAGAGHWVQYEAAGAFDAALGAALASAPAGAA